jgi:hypothetical protein
VEITELRKGEEEAWDSYIYESDMCTSYHQIGWKNIVEKTYGHKPRCLVARANDGGIIGVLPMFLMGAGVWREAGIGSVCAVWWGCADDNRGGRVAIEEMIYNKGLLHRWNGQAHDDSRIIRRFCVHR